MSVENRANSPLPDGIRIRLGGAKANAEGCSYVANRFNVGSIVEVDERCKILVGHGTEDVCCVGIYILSVVSSRSPEESAIKGISIPVFPPCA